MRRKIGAVFAVGLMLAACGDDGSNASDDSAPPAAATSAPDDSVDLTTPVRPDSTEPEATEPDSTEPDSTEPDSTEPEPTASLSTSTTPETTTAPTTGWVASNFVPAASVMGYSGNWAGEGGTSPAAPSAGETPADGYYVASLRAPWTPGDDDLMVRVERLEMCTALPDGCEIMEPDEMNVDPSWHLDIDVPLDPTTDVIVQGHLCWDDPQQKQATGLELADLFEAYTTDYAAVIAPHLADGISSWEVAEQIAATPAGGFVSESSVCPDEASGLLRYIHDDAPVLLMQTVTDWDGGPLDASDLIGLNGVQYIDGTPVFYFYAGFYS